MKAKKKRFFAGVLFLLLFMGFGLLNPGSINVQAEGTPAITADCSDIQREVDPCMFGYILTPNYDVPDSRLTLLGSLLNRETLPVQNFQAIGDLDGSYYTYEGSVKERHLEAFRRAKSCGFQWYMLMGMNPSWATASGSPMDTSKNEPLKTKEQLANFKQYIKDVLQFMKDNGAKPDYADLTNEYWTGTEETYRVVWEALREVYPDDIPAVGPGGVGFGGIPDFYIPYASDNDITVEGPSWHAFWKDDKFATFPQLTKWADTIRSLQEQYPKANGKYIIWEENNAGSTNPTDWARSMSNVIRTGVDKNIKGCMESKNWNGMSDLMTTNVKQQNPAARRPIWWVYYMFSQMSGDYVQVSTTGDTNFTGAVSVDRGESTYTLTLSQNKDLSSPVVVKEDLTETTYTLPEPLEKGTVYYWGVTATNKNGSVPVSHNAVYSFLTGDSEHVPGQFGPYMPSVGAKNEDLKPELKWSTAYKAKSYHVIVSQNEDLSDPVVDKRGITTVRSTGQFGDASQGYYKIREGLEPKTTYYWMVYAENAEGERPMNGVLHYFTTKGEGTSPEGFQLTYPEDGMSDVSGRTELTWEESANAFFYQLEISDQEDMSNIILQRDYMIYNKYTVEQNALEPGKTYYWRVTAYTKDRRKFTECADEVRSFTVEKTPNSPLLYAEQPGEEEGTVTLWFRPSNMADSYSVYYGKQEGIYTRKISGITDKTYTISGLKGGQTYYFTVKAVNSAGESSIWNVRKAVPKGNGENWTEANEEGEYLPPPPTETEPPVPSTSQTPTQQGPDFTPVTAPPHHTTQSTVKKPSKVVIKKLLSKKKHTMKITWKKADSSGYQIMIANNKKMKKGKKTYLVRSKKKTTLTINKLKSRRRYYVKVRAYRTAGSKKIYGKWSQVKKIRIK